MNKDSKRRVAFEVINILGILAILCLVTRIWPLLFLVIPGILIAALRLLFLSTQKTVKRTTAKKAAVKNTTVSPYPENEQDVICIAFGILQRRIAEDVTTRYPAARFVWGVPNPIENFIQDLPLSIILNRAGGFSKAVVQVHNLQFKGLLYETVIPEQTEELPDESADSEPSDDNTHNDSEPVDTEPVDYSVLAYEWVDTNFMRINEMCNKAIGEKSRIILIQAKLLPLMESWGFICQQLKNAGFPDAIITENGILIILS